MKAAATAGAGVAWLPKWLAIEAIRERSLRRVLADAVLPPMIIVAVTHKQARASSAIRAVLDYLAEQLPAPLLSITLAA